MKGEYISMETSKIMADIEKENKELHDRIEKLEKINKRLWEENARLSNGRELDQNAIDNLRERIEKAIEKLNTQLAFTSSYQLNYQGAMVIIEETKNILKGDK